MSNPWYERLKQIDPSFLAKAAKSAREYRAIKRLDPEWVAKEREAHKRRLQDPERAARYKEKKRLYIERVQNDPELRERRNQKAREWRIKHPGRTKEYDRKKFQKNRKNNPLSYILQGAKNTAKTKGFDFNITKEDLKIPDVCPVLGIPVIAFAEGGIRNPSTASIDRIDPKKGYIKGNVKIISWEANRIKNNCADPEVFLAIARYLKENLNKDVDGSGLN